MVNSASATPARKRAVANTPDVKVARYALYEAAYARVNASVEGGYYLEAITIIESLLTDRLASRLISLKSNARAFDAAGPLCSSLELCETDVELLALVQSVRLWAKGRNRALHEMAKLEDGRLESWPDRYAKNREVALEGKRLLSRVDKRVKALRRPVRGEPVEP